MNEIKVVESRNNGLVKGLGLLGAALLVGGLAYKLGMPLLKKNREPEPVEDVVEDGDFREVEESEEE